MIGRVVFIFNEKPTRTNFSLNRKSSEFFLIHDVGHTVDDRPT